MEGDANGGRSVRWRAVTTLAESSRHACGSFDPEESAPVDAVRDGIDPLLTEYVRCCRDGVRLSAVERSLLEGALNDWLRAYAAARGLRGFEGTAFSIHELALEYARAGDVVGAVERLFSER